MIWENWLVAISVGIIAIAFVVLVIFMIIALLSLKQMVKDLDQKVRTLDPLFRVVSKAGNIIEKKTERDLADAEQAFYKEREQTRNGGVGTVVEVAEWALIGLSLWQKIKDRRRFKI